MTALEFWWLRFVGDIGIITAIFIVLFTRVGGPPGPPGDEH